MRKNGFQLIEILICLAIIGVLATLALPQYQRYLAKESRLSAEMSLMNIASQMEVYFIEHNSYFGATLETLHIPRYSEDKRYMFAINETQNNDYEISAIPLLKQARADLPCGILLFNVLGEKKITGSANIKNCW